MSALLYVEASPRKERSHANAVAQSLLDAHSAAHPGGKIDRLDVWAEELIPFDGDVLDAKYAVLHGQVPTGTQQKAWSAVEAEFARFAAADAYLFSVPMWNFGIPYKLKHYIDVITQPGLAFAFSPETGFEGLVTGKPAVVVYSRGGAYPPGSEMAAVDFQKPYLEHWLGFIGFTDIRPVLVEPTLGAPEDVAKTVEAASDAARAFGRGL